MTSPWDIPGINERLRELHALGLYFSEIAEGLNAEYGTTLTRFACIGRAHRLKLPDRHSIVWRKPNKPPILYDPIPIERLNRTNCHYPLGEFEDRPPYLFCGGPARNGFSWCARHYRKVYTPAKSRSA